MLEKIGIHLEDWTRRCPSGCVLSYSDDSYESEYCDSVEDFKVFLSQFKDDISEDSPQVIISFDAEDLGISNVIEVATEIANFIKETK